MALSTTSSTDALEQGQGQDHDFADGSDQGEANDPAKKESDLEARLTQVEQQSAESKILAQLAADPDISAILRARRTGQRVKVVEDRPTAPEDTIRLPGSVGTTTPEPEIDDSTLEGMSNAQLSKHIARRTLTDLVPLLNEALKPLSTRLQALAGSVDQVETERAKNSVAAVQAKYKDFTKYRDAMIDIRQSNPGLEVEELYFLAKKRAGGQLFGQHGTDIERPTTQVARPSRPTPKGPVVGRGAFRDHLRGVLASMDHSDLDKLSEE
jgi:hypothetical protein